MAKVRTPRAAWIEAALSALAAGGPEAVRVEALATSLGVSKGGFYWHFKDRRALLAEMLDSWEKAGTEEVIAQFEGREGDPREKLRQLFEMSPSADFEVELAVRDWARRDPDVAARLPRIDRRRMEFFRSLFREFCSGEDEVEARSTLAYSLMIGSYFIGQEEGGGSRSRAMRRAFEALLDQSRESK